MAVGEPVMSGGGEPLLPLRQGVVTEGQAVAQTLGRVSLFLPFLQQHLEGQVVKKAGCGVTLGVSEQVEWDLCPGSRTEVPP